MLLLTSNSEFVLRTSLYILFSRGMLQWNPAVTMYYKIAISAQDVSILVHVSKVIQLNNTASEYYRGGK